jgi:hypothetical protein
MKMRLILTKLMVSTKNKIFEINSGSFITHCFAYGDDLKFKIK